MNEQVPLEVDLQPNCWYRTPLSKSDHLIGNDPVWLDDGVAWCGFPLTHCRDWVNDEYGGLWYSERKSMKCAGCVGRQAEWDSRNEW